MELWGIKKKGHITLGQWQRIVIMRRETILGERSSASGDKEQPERGFFPSLPQRERDKRKGGEMKAIDSDFSTWNLH
ncbi:hypothetical protein CEXT_674521 [Caerostris extrusa]|uniref:Uncharacterized protein n=1 Tax=Caerostris extrusa TaxID=172846 RepID=A0AAV4S6F4_CAEEX|nr:hypothetical protein CEXT_674521 [Caerostris extrusa]